MIMLNYKPFLSSEWGVQSWLDVSSAPLAARWKLFLLSDEEQFDTNSSTQAIPRIMSLKQESRHWSSWKLFLTSRDCWDPAPWSRIQDHVCLELWSTIQNILREILENNDDDDESGHQLCWEWGTEQILVQNSSKIWLVGVVELNMKKNKICFDRNSRKECKHQRSDQPPTESTWYLRRIFSRHWSLRPDLTKRVNSGWRNV